YLDDRLDPGKDDVQKNLTKKPQTLMNPALRTQYLIWCYQPIMPTSSPPASDSQASVFKIWVHLTRITAPSSTTCRSCRLVVYCACGRSEERRVGKECRCGGASGVELK